MKGKEENKKRGPDKDGEETRGEGKGEIKGAVKGEKINFTALFLKKHHKDLNQKTMKRFINNS